MKKSLWIIVAIIAVFVVVLLSNSYNNEQKSRDSSKITIGAILNLTGSFADQGENSKNAIEMAVKEINDAGGILGKKMTVEYQDNLGDNPKGGLTAFYNLTSRDVKLLIGPNMTPTANVLAPIVEKEDAVIIAPSVGSEKFAEASPRTFNLFPPNKFDSYALAGYIFGKGIRKIAIFGSQQEWEMDQAGFVKNRFEQLGGVVTSMQLPTVDNKDLRAEATKIKSSNPEAIVFTNYGQRVVAARRLKELNVNLPFFSVLLLEEEIGQAQGDLEGIVFVTTDTSDGTFNEKYNKIYSKAPGFPANQAYDAVNLYAKAITDAKSTEPAKVATALANIKTFAGASGDITFDSDGNAHKPTLYYQVKSNKITPLVL